MRRISVSVSVDVNWLYRLYIYMRDNTLHFCAVGFISNTSSHFVIALLLIRVPLYDVVSFILIIFGMLITCKE